MIHIHTSSEEFDSVIGTLIALDVGDGSTVSDSVEGQPVSLVLRVEGVAGVFNPDVFQRAGVIVLHTSTVWRVADL